MTDINQAGLEAARLAIAGCKAVGRTTVEDHAYEAVTAYLATKGGEDAPQATDDDLVARLEFVRDVLASLAYLSYADDVKAAATRIEEDAKKYRDRIEQLEAEVERHINTAAELRLALDSVLECYVNMINSVDCGNWNPETKPEGIAARAALADTPEGK